MAACETSAPPAELSSGAFCFVLFPSNFCIVLVSDFAIYNAYQLNNVSVSLYPYGLMRFVCFIDSSHPSGDEATAYSLWGVLLSTHIDSAMCRS